MKECEEKDVERKETSKSYDKEIADNLHEISKTLKEILREMRKRK